MDRRRQRYISKESRTYTGRIAVLQGTYIGRRQAPPCTDRNGERGVYRRDIRSVQQEQDAQRRHLYPKAHAIRTNGTTSIGDAWGVKTKAAHAVRNGKSCGTSEGESTWRSRRMGAATAIEWWLLLKVLTVVVRSTLPKASAVAAARVRNEVWRRAACNRQRMGVDGGFTDHQGRRSK